MALYKVNVDVYVEAETAEDAAASVLDNMEYICDLDNDLVNAEVALKGELMGACQDGSQERL